jgi:rod shape-determining protein MreC
MFDRKVIRRRRAALAVFVVLSVALITAYFGESGGGPLNSLQRGAQEAFAPIESGASRAFKPVRDLFGWVGDTVDAKGENKELEQQVERLRSELARAQTAQRDARELRGLADVRTADGFPSGTEPVTARVIGRSPSAWYSVVKIDKGTSDGIRVDQPVIASGGLAGRISRVTGGTAEVKLITDPSSGVSAQVMPNGAHGTVTAEVGNTGNLVLDFLEKGRRVTDGTTVVTSGSTSSRLESLFPRGILIGEVTDVDSDEIELFERVHVKPFADVRGMDFVQVLTKRGIEERAQVVTP